MPSRRQSRVQAPNAIVGAARRVHINRSAELEEMRMRATAEWQRLAWHFYDDIAEIKFGYNYFASVASRIRLYVGYQDEASDTPTPIGDVMGVSRSFVTAARYELSKLDQGVGGQADLVRRAILNYLVTGEWYLVGHNDSWSIRSISELHFEVGNRIRLQTSQQNSGRSAHTYLPESAYVARAWRPSPEYFDDAESALKGVRGPASELLLLARIIRASAQSRLNAGILYVADELRFQRSSDPTGAGPTRDVDPFEEELEIALTEPIGASDSPSEIMPMIVRGPAEFAASGITKVDLSRGFDKTVVERHDQTLQRVLNGIDIPKDLVTGLANVRYSNGKIITEDLLKSHVEPYILLLCEALTSSFLRTRMEARGYDPQLVKKLVVWYDPSEVVTRPDRSEDADKGYERMLISGSTWRRAHGFSDSDKPTDEEIAQRIALSGSVAPSTTLDFLRQLAPDLVKEAEKLAQESFGDPELATNGQPHTGAPTIDVTPDDENDATIPAAPSPAAQPSIAPEADPPEGSPAPVEAMSANDARAEQVMDILHAISAAAAAKSQPDPVVRERTRKLERTLEVERRLRESLFVHLNDVVHRSLERAGARTVSKIRNSDIKSLATDVPIECVFSVVPETRLQEFALDPRKLVEDTLAKARNSFVKLITEAQDQGWRALGPEVFEQMKPRQAGLLDRAWDWVIKQLTTLAAKFLKNPNKGGNYVPMTVIRDATSLAGGGEILSDDVKNAGPIGSGKAILSATVLDATGWEFSNRFRWVYGVSENSYQPHLRLDDTVFDSWSAKELATPDAEQWPYVTHHYPGDHDGCRCDWLPEVLDPKQVNAPVRGQTWDDAPLAASIAANGSSVVSSNGSGHNVRTDDRK